MNSINTNIFKTLKESRIITRPDASPGYWVQFLFPIAIIVSYARNPQIASFQYKLATLVATGFIVSSIVTIVQCSRKNSFKIGIPHLLTAVYTSSLFYTCLHKGILFSVLSGFFIVFSYLKGLPILLRICPKCFTFGEASLVLQAVVLFFYIAAINIVESIVHTPMKICHISNIILQVGIIGLAVICFFVYKFKFFRKTLPFYTLTIFVLFTGIFLPLHVILQKSPVLWIISLLTDKYNTIKMITFWLTCTILAIISLRRQIQEGKKANTVVRKIFHILAVLVLLPGLIDQCPVLYLASGIVFAIFIALEMLRVLNLPPLGIILQDGFTVFSDEKDVGGIALTPIYLLVGCSMPFWMHPEPCDVTDSAGFHLLPLISGLLSVGVGDTMASTFGILLGRHKWPSTKKTFEGTVGCIVSQLALVYILIHFGFITNNNDNVTRASVAVIVSSFVEAKTDQVDNLILPLVSYIILV